MIAKLSIRTALRASWCFLKRTKLATVILGSVHRMSTNLDDDIQHRELTSSSGLVAHFAGDIRLLQYFVTHEADPMIDRH